MTRKYEDKKHYEFNCDVYLSYELLVSLKGLQ